MSESGCVTSVNASNLSIQGNLIVSGETTTINTTNTTIKDTLIELNSGLTGANANDSGILIERGTTGNNAFMGWDELEDSFILGTTTNVATDTGNLTVASGTLQVSGITRTSSQAAQDLTIALAGATNSSLVLSSTGTDVDALQVTASAGGMDITSAKVMDITTSANNANIIIDPHGSGTLALGSDDNTAVTMDALALTLTSVNALTLTDGTATLAFNGSGATTLSGSTTVDLDCSGAMSLNSGGGVINIGDEPVEQAINIGTGAAARTITLGNATGATALDVNLGTGGLTVDCTDGGAISLDANGAPSNFTLESTADADDLTIALTGVTNSSLILSSTGTGNDALQVTASAGGMDITSAGVLELNSSAGAINIGNDAVAQAINVGTGAAARTITIGNDASTKVDINALAIELDSAAAMTLSSVGAIGMDTVGTAAINIGTEAAAKTITIGNDASTKVDINALAIELDSAAAMTLSSGGALAIDTVGTDAIDIGTEAVAKTITIGNDASTKVDINALAIELDSAGSIILNSVTTTGITSTGVLTMDTSGTAAINIGTEAAAKTITIGNDASTKVDINALAIELDTTNGVTVSGDLAVSGSARLGFKRYVVYTVDLSTLDGSVTAFTDEDVIFNLGALDVTTPAGITASQIIIEKAIFNVKTVADTALNVKLHLSSDAGTAVNTELENDTEMVGAGATYAAGGSTAADINLNSAAVSVITSNSSAAIAQARLYVVTTTALSANVTQGTVNISVEYSVI